MKKLIISLVLCGGLLIGCAQFTKNAQDANSQQNKAIATVQAGAQATQAVITATGQAATPWGALTLLGTTVIGVLGTAYQTWRKGLSDTQLNQTTLATTAIIKAIEDVGAVQTGTTGNTTIGDVVKAAVEKNMGSANYSTLNAVVDGIKATL